MGTLALITNKDRASIRVAGEEIFVVTKAAGGIKISARVISSSNQVVAVITDNELYVNPSDRFKMRRPDWHSLIVEDTQDKNKRKVLDVYFLNPLYVRVYAEFFIPGGVPFIVGEKFSQIGSNQEIGGSPTTPPGFCLQVTDKIGRSSINLGGVTLVAE